MKKFPIIHIPNQYLLIVNETTLPVVGDSTFLKLKEGGIALFKVAKPKTEYDEICKHKKSIWISWVGKNYSQTLPVKDFKKLLSHLPLNNSPLLEGVAKLPEIEDDVFNLEKFLEPFILDNGHLYCHNTPFLIKKIKEGYKANPNKYTEEDLRKSMLHTSKRAYDFFVNRKGVDTYGNHIADYIQSLSQPKIPVAFEAEMEITDAFVDEAVKETAGKPYNYKNVPIQEVKIIDNIWQGKYIYNDTNK